MQSAPALQETGFRFDEPVRSLLKFKGHVVWSVPPDATVLSAVQLMAEKQIGCLVVLSGGYLAGTISERDYARKIVLKGRHSYDTQVREIMSTPALYVTPDQTIDIAMKVMTQRRVRHLPVLEGDTVLAVLSIGDIVNWIVSHRG